ncbi:hypothetical protein [Jeotgalibacillus sp. R-1-5s-1]|uniref:hypothetical protein n=1 Tax=Jeotgalibacillus sp. R-1-5s-1 TaxID=2555897 RepID=UPI00141B6C1B|nr:hypothetical protein [Jeotgalibacillus sp. R-1-5s-1]
MEKECLVCGAELVDDAWEIIEQGDQGEIELNSFPAWVCSERCGYYKKQLE